MQLLVLLLTFLLLKDILKNLYETWKLHSCLVSRRETHFGARLFSIGFPGEREPWGKNLVITVSAIGNYSETQSCHENQRH